MKLLLEILKKPFLEILSYEVQFDKSLYDRYMFFFKEILMFFILSYIFLYLDLIFNFDKLI